MGVGWMNLQLIDRISMTCVSLPQKIAHFSGTHHRCQPTSGMYVYVSLVLTVLQVMCDVSITRITPLKPPMINRLSPVSVS